MEQQYLHFCYFIIRILARGRLEITAWSKWGIMEHRRLGEMCLNVMNIITMQKIFQKRESVQIFVYASSCDSGILHNLCNLIWLQACLIIGTHARQSLFQLSLLSWLLGDLLIFFIIALVPIAKAEIYCHSIVIYITTRFFLPFHLFLNLIFNFLNVTRQTERDKVE